MHVQLDYMTQHVEADDAEYDLKIGARHFSSRARDVCGAEAALSPTLLISPNPIYFEADEAERVDQDTYRIHKAWMTVCDPDKPTWKFYAPSATVYMKKSVHLENGNFRPLVGAGFVFALRHVSGGERAHVRLQRFRISARVRQRATSSAMRCIGRPCGLGGPDAGRELLQPLRLVAERQSADEARGKTRSWT